MVPLRLPALIRTDRISLPLVTAAEARSGVRGERWHEDYPRADDLDAFVMIRDESTDAGSWGPRHIVRRVDGLVVGSIGFFGAPVDGEVEVGYGLVPYARGHGVATEVLRALLAEADALGVKVRASTEPDNTASLKVLAKCGFTELRGSNEDGQLVMARPLRTRD